MKAYIYDEHGYYVGEDIAPIDPLESALQGRDIYIMPANSTDKEPLEPKDGFTVKWDGKQWVYEEKQEAKKIIPEPVDEAMEKRAERDILLDSMQWRIDRYEEQRILGIETADTEETYLLILSYKQYLRDIPQQESFPNVEIKTFDEWLVK